MEWNIIIILIALCIVGTAIFCQQPEVVVAGNFQFILHEKNDPIAKELIQDIAELASEVQQQFDMEWLKKIATSVELVGAQHDDQVVKRDLMSVPTWLAAYAIPGQDRIVIRYKNVGSY